MLYCNVMKGGSYCRYSSAKVSSSKPLVAIVAGKVAGDGKNAMVMKVS